MSASPFTHPVIATLDHHLFAFGGKRERKKCDTLFSFGGKRVIKRYTSPSFPLAEERGDKRSDVGVNNRTI
jgi:hypothetical protein